MAQIQVLDNRTIDKIAAGEVVEKPCSVVKELVENSIDSGATAITVEIKGGGIELIRVTDNGCGIAKEEVPNAFLRHATSKIESAEDLFSLNSLGFRGEALASIAAVSQAEMITKTEDALTGTRIAIEGGTIKEQQEIGAPNGTTIIVRNLFFNTPARKKFLKTAATEGAYVSELMQHMAMSIPEMSIKLVVNNLTRFHTSGNGNLKEVIYRIYGRDIANAMIPVSYEQEGIRIEGYLGKPELARANRSYENYFVNRRYVKSELLSKGIEEGYHAYMMQHRFPFCALHIGLDTSVLDVNVHPTKMEVRISNHEEVIHTLVTVIERTMGEKELIPQVSFEEPDKTIQPKKIIAPEPFEKKRIETTRTVFEEKMENSSVAEVKSEDKSAEIIEHVNEKEVLFSDESEDKISSARIIGEILKPKTAERDIHSNIIKQHEHIIVEKAEQLNFFDEKILSKEAKQKYRIVGQIFQTFWLIEYEDKIIFMDQHAAHEKVKYEDFIRKYRNKEILSQNLSPAIVVTLQPLEVEVYERNASVFEALGFEIENFGKEEFAIRAVPIDLYGCNEKELFLEIMDDLVTEKPTQDTEVIANKIASMSCKAAVKGNHTLSQEELLELMDNLLELDNPYHCPHGRPTMITMSKSEVEKKFKRIV